MRSLVAIFSLFFLGIVLALPQESEFQRGEKLFKERNYNEAIAVFKKILDRAEWDELSAKSALRLGQCYWALKENDEARHFFDQAMGWGGDIAGEARIGMAVTYLSEKKFDQAISMLSDVISRYKSDKILAYAYCNRGLAYEGKNWISRALDDLVRAKERAKGDKELLQSIEEEIKKCRALYQEFQNKENDYLQQIQSAQAIGDLDKCAGLLRELAKFCEDWGEMESAIDYEKQAIEYSSSEEFKAGSWMAIGWRYFKLNDYEKAAEAFNNVVEEYPLSTYAKEALLRLGDMYGSSGKHDDEAIKAYEEFVGKYPKDELVPETLLKIAWRYRAMQEREKELAVLKELSERFPDKEYGVFALGLYYEDKGEYEKAMEAYKKAAEFHGSQRPLALLGLGTCAYSAGHYRTALESLDSLLSEYPALDSEAGGEAEWLRGKCYLSLGYDTDKVISHFRKLSEMYPDSRWEKGARAQIVYAYLAKGNIDLAKREQEQIIKRYGDRDPKFVSQMLFEWGKFFFGKAEYREAIAEFEKAMELYPSLEPQALIEIGRCYRLMGDYEAAMKSIEKALPKLEGGDAVASEAIWELMRCYEHKLDFPSAIRAYHSFKALISPQDPMNESIKFRVGYYHLQIGELQEACRIWEEIIGETPENDPFHNLSIMLLKNYQKSPSSPTIANNRLGDKGTTRIIGPISNQLLDATGDFLKGEVLLIYGIQSKDEKENTACEKSALTFRDFNKKKYGYSLPCKKDTDVSSEELGKNNLILFGTPHSNKILASLSDILPIKMGNKEIKVGDRVYEGENIGVIMLLPNPYNKDKFLLIYSAFAPYLQENIQSIFHGPTDYVIFSEDPSEKGATRVVEVGFFLKSSPAQWKTFSFHD